MSKLQNPKVIRQPMKLSVTLSDSGHVMLDDN